jgi:hypothetical protein
MCTKKEIIIFFAGFETFHTLAHLLFYAYGLTIHLTWISVTPKLNLAAFIINLLIATGLFYWASQFKK